MLAIVDRAMQAFCDEYIAESHQSHAEMQQAHAELQQVREADKGELQQAHEALLSTANEKIVQLQAEVSDLQGLVEAQGEPWR